MALSDPVYQATYPELARLIHEGATADARRLTDSIRRRAWLVIVPACMLVTLLAGWVIPLVFGTAYTSAVPLVQLLVWQLVWIPYLWVPGLLLSMGKAGVVASLTGVDAVDLRRDAPRTRSHHGCHRRGPRHGPPLRDLGGRCSRARPPRES